jgi:alpha-tubulin suppressor-like RCC1 family protein
VEAWGWYGPEAGEAVVPAGVTNVVAIGAGGNYCMAVRTDGTVLAWGENLYGQASVPAGLSNVISVAPGQAHSVALRADGTVVAWGNNSLGQTNVPAGLTGVVAVASGDSHSLALKSDGTLVAWGYDVSGQASVPAGLTNVVCVAAGGEHTVALRSDGTVVAWGENSLGQTSVPAGLANVTAIAAHAGDSIALRADGTVVVWGDNSAGQRRVPPGLNGVVAVAAGQDHCLALSGNCEAPYLSAPVIGQTVAIGDTVQLRVSARGATPLSYQWRFGGVDVPGATNAVWTMSDVGLEQGGRYDVLVSNPFGALQTPELVLEVVPLLIETQPRDQVGYVGRDASFSVSVHGLGPLTFQWQCQGTNLPGATAPTLTLADLRMDQSAPYAVAVSNPFGVGQSRDAMLSVVQVAAWGDNTFGQTAAQVGVSNLVAVAGGQGFSLALCADGTVVGWGDNTQGQTTVPTGLSDVVAISAGLAHSLVLKEDGKIVAWGYNVYGQANVPAGVTNVVAISAGGYHNLALCADHTVVAWGYNSWGQSTVPAGLNNAVAVAAGLYHSLALRADGTVVGWGDNTWGAAAVPPGLSNVVAIASGAAHSLALRTDGTVVAWGNAMNMPSYVEPPAGLTNVVAIAAGAQHSLALLADGTPVAWGADESHQCDAPAGLGGVIAVSAGWNHSLALEGYVPLVARPPAGQVVAFGGSCQLEASISGAAPFSYQWSFNGVDLPGATNAVLSLTNVVLTQTGSYAVRVSNAFGVTTSQSASLQVVPFFITRQPQDATVLVGDGVTFSVGLPDSGPFTFQWQRNGVDLPAETNNTLSLTGLRSTQSGPYAVLVGNAIGTVRSLDALLIVQEVAAWGQNSAGQTNVPPNLSNVVAVAAGGRHSLALLGDGTVAAWGDGHYGQTNVPLGLAAALAIAAGDSHSLALCADGTVVAWGRNNVGQTNVPSGLTNAVAVAAGANHSLALQADGAVMAWGDNGAAEANVPAGLGDVVAIAAGANHDLALLAGGTVVAWGLNPYGQCSVPEGLTNAVAVAAGHVHSLALRSDGTVVAWGNNTYGAATVPDGLNDVVAIAAGIYHSIALRRDGRAVAWGAVRAGESLVSSRSNVVAVAEGCFASHCLAVLGDGAPFLVTRPLGRVVAGGETLRLDVNALGAPPMSYQWQFDGTELPGATNAVLYITNTQPAQAGAYAVQVGNSLGSVVTPAATIYWVPLWIAVQPQNQTSFRGARAAFRVIARASEPVLYQWQSGGSALPGETNSTLLLPRVRSDQAGVYAVEVSNAYGRVRSADANLGVLPAEVAWGINYDGQTNIPSSLTGVQALAAGYTHVLALQGDGTVVAWGRNHVGQTNVPVDLTNAVAISAGGSSSMAIRADRTVVAWGDNRSGQALVPAGLTDVAAISAGSDASLALKTDGTVVAWGMRANPPVGLGNVVAVAAGSGANLALKADGTVTAWGRQRSCTNVPPGLADVVAVASGDLHCAALKADGTVVAWGNNNTGQTNVPVGLSNVVAIAAAGDCTLALKTDGTVVAWGDNYFHQTEVPAGLNNVSAVGSGGGVSLALIGSGTPHVVSPLLDRATIRGDTIHVLAQAVGAWPMTYQWQFNGTNLPGANHPLLTLTHVEAAQSGEYAVTVSNDLGTTTSPTFNVQLVPVFITSPPQSQTNLVGEATTFSVSVRGNGPFAYQWQFNGTNLPAATNATLTLTSVLPDQAGSYRVVVRSVDGTVTSAEATLSVKPLAIIAQPEDQTALWLGTAQLAVAVQGVGPFSYRWQFMGADILGATNDILALPQVQFDQAGTYAVVVSNPYGSVRSVEAMVQVTAVIAWGRNSFGQTNVPAGLTDVAAIASGGDFSLVLRSDGTVMAFGDNRFGQTDVPAGLDNAVGMAAGGSHSLALLADGTVAAWGYGDYGETTVPAGLADVVAVAAGAYHSMALRADGTLTVWGHNLYGQTSVPLGLTNIVAIAAGDYHCLALTTTGTVLAWGMGAGQTNVPAGLSNVVAISGGGLHSLALRSDGQVVAWGNNGYGQVDVPAGLADVQDIAAGENYSLALKRDGTVTVWGDQTDVPQDLRCVGAIAAGYFHSLALVRQVPPAPWIVKVEKGPEMCQVSLPTLRGWQYWLEFTDSLSDPVWQATGQPPMPGDGAVKSLADTSAGPHYRLYRVCMQ